MRTQRDNCAIEGISRLRHWSAPASSATRLQDSRFETDQGNTAGAGLCGCSWAETAKPFGRGVRTRTHSLAVLLCLKLAT